MVKRAVAKDRAAPFSRKHRRYWIPVLGGMIVIGIFNVALGMCAYPGADEFNREPEQIEVVIPPVRHLDAAPGPGSGSGSGAGSGSGTNQEAP
jgi:hypothetical protein